MLPFISNTWQRASVHQVWVDTIHIFLYSCRGSKLECSNQHGMSLLEAVEIDVLKIMYNLLVKWI